jgi:hypothetical protein
MLKWGGDFGGVNAVEMSYGCHDMYNHLWGLEMCYHVEWTRWVDVKTYA